MYYAYLLAVFNMQLADGAEPFIQHDADDMQVDDHGPVPPSPPGPDRNNNGSNDDNSNDDASEPNPDHGQRPASPATSWRSVAASEGSADEDYVPIWSLNPLDMVHFEEEWQLEAHRNRKFYIYSYYSVTNFHDRSLGRHARRLLRVSSRQDL